MKKILVICSLSVTIAANAANHYIRAGATGANNGTDWSNAWTTLPGSYVRGDTYYVADGTYVGNFVFSTPESGSALITFQKAVPCDHGTATGWSDAFGAGQSVFSATSGIVIRPQTGYWVFDGQVGSGDGSAARHGFKFATSDTANPCIYVINNYLVRFLTFSHVEVQGHGWYQGTDNTPLFENNSTAACSNFTFQSCYFHDCGGGWITSHQNAPNVLIEHCYFRNAGSGNPSFHMAGVILYGRQSGMNVTVRYNAFENVGSIGGSGYLCLGDDATSVTSDGYDVYGNVFFSTSANEGPGLYVVGNASA